MKMTGWWIGGIFAAGGVAAIWFAWPRESLQKPAPTSVAVAPAKDAFGNRLTGEEPQEPIAEVIEVIDLSEVYQPRPERDDAQPIEFDFDAFNRLPRPMPAPELVPYPRVVGDPSSLPRYGEETSEPPAFTTASKSTLSNWMRAACVDWLNRLMPLKGSVSPSPSQTDSTNE